MGITKENYGYLTYDKCKEIALTYNRKSDLQKNNGSAYHKIINKKWLELFDHMEVVCKPSGYWNYERCKEEALKYTTRVGLQKGNGTVHNAIKKNGWVELLDHMVYIQKPVGYWDYERCKTEALQYSRRVDLQKGKPSVYHIIQKNEWFELLDHMEYICRPAGYWTIELCKELTSKYTTWKDFISENYAAYVAIGKNKWQIEVGSHLIYSIKPNDYWTYDLCKEVASKYSSIYEIRNSNDSHAYIRIKKKGWNDLIEHFIELIKPAGYWTYERCKEEALNYKTRKDLAQNSKVAYQTIRKNKWFELVEHMPFQDNIKSRYIYVFEFDNNSVYIGLSWKPEKRKSDHLTNKKTRIYNYLLQNDVKYEFKVISGKLTEIEAQKEEAKKIKEYKNNGWEVLNLATAGGLGSMHAKWDYKGIKKILDTCTTLSELYSKLPPHAITRMRKEGFYNEMVKELIHDMNPPKYWHDKEICRECASKFKYKAHFQKAFSGAYKAAIKFGWLDEFFKNKTEQLMDDWNDKEKCHSAALNFNSRNAFRNKFRYAYNISVENGWLDEICSHMGLPKWTFESCREESLKYKCRHHLEKGCGSAYRFAFKNGLLDIFYPK